MVTDDDRLEQLLSEEPGRHQPGPAPVEAVFRRAKVARVRRRNTVLAGLAAVAVVGVSAPILGTAGPWHDAAGQTQRISVDTPVVDSSGRTVFSGVDDGKRWKVTVNKDSCENPEIGLGCEPDGRTIELAGDVPTEPANLGASGYSASSPIGYWVHLRSDVAHLDVDLTDGERLTLVPVELGHTRLALFQVPRRLGITRITAYAADERVIAYSIPYQSPDAAVVAMWYRPDQEATEPEVAGTLSGTTAKGVKGSAEVHIGPFGICYTTRHQWSGLATTICEPLAVPASPSDAVPDGLPDWIALGDQVDPKVDHVDFSTSTGTRRAEKVRIGGHAFAVCFVDPGFTMISRTFYDSSGKVIGYDPTPTKP